MRKGEWSSWKAAEKVEVTGEETLLLSNWINKMMEMKGLCGTVKKMNQSWCLTTGFAPGLFKKCCCFFFLRWPWLTCLFHWTTVEDVCSPAWVIRKQSEKSEPENKFDHTRTKNPLYNSITHRLRIDVQQHDLQVKLLLTYLCLSHTIQSRPLHSTYST